MHLSSKYTYQNSTKQVKHVKPMLYFIKCHFISVVLCHAKLVLVMGMHVSNTRFIIHYQCMPTHMDLYQFGMDIYLFTHSFIVSADGKFRQLYLINVSKTEAQDLTNQNHLGCQYAIAFWLQIFFCPFFYLIN